MSLIKASMLTMGFAGAVALGVALAPYLTNEARDVPALQESVAAPAPIEAPRTVATPTRFERVTMERVAAVDVTAPALHDRVRSVLAPGTNVEMAADGFTNAEQFVTIVHLARNTGVPFVLLKHRVLNEGRSLTSAVKMSKPEADAEREVNRAKAEARADIWSIG